MGGISVSRPAALIVEDQPIFGLVASDILREAGYDAFQAHDAHDAAALLRKHPEIQVLVTDAELPGPIDGLTLARDLLQTRPDMHLIFTSSKEGPRAADVPQGARVLHKPYASGELRTAVAARAFLQDA